MSENETDDKKLSVNPKKTLTLRGGGVSQGTVRQSFSHGRSKAVVVETRKRRLTRPGDAKAAPEQEQVAPAPEAETVVPPAAAEVAEVKAETAPEQTPAPKAAPPKPAVSEAPATPDETAGRTTRKKTIEPGPNLSKSEMDARKRALEEAQAREDADRNRREEESRKRAEETARRLAEREQQAEKTRTAEEWRRPRCT